VLALVTGGEGFIGSNLVDALVDALVDSTQPYEYSMTRFPGHRNNLTPPPTSS